ncbi:MAG: hypothetical protein LUD68_00080 [Rikenellaceae bacterium]|nr:hypothetical protein [Rikenellaceae bacterium]
MVMLFCFDGKGKKIEKKLLVRPSGFQDIPVLFGMPYSCRKKRRGIRLEREMEFFCEGMFIFGTDLKGYNRYVDDFQTAHDLR